MTKYQDTVAEKPDGLARLKRWRDSAADRLNRWFAAFDAILAGEPAWISAITATLVLQIVLTTQHRPWLDEWQALQLAVQSPRLSDLMLALRYEGHPPLWYLILRGLASVLPDPTWALPIAALIIAIPLQLTILLRAPFSRAERLMLALSEFVLFEYLTLSRSLTLGIALMFAIAALWKRHRVVWLLIAILPMCDFLFGVVAAIFVALRWREGRITWPLAGLWVITGAIAACSIRPMPDMVPALFPKPPIHELPQWLANMATLGLPLQWDILAPRWNAPPPPGLGGPALLGFFAVAWIELRKKPEFAIAFAGFVLLLLVFSLGVYELSNRHLMIAAILLIVLVWRLADGNLAQTVWWRLWLMVISSCGLFTATISLAEPFDTASDATAMIAALHLRDKTWVPFPHNTGQGIAALNGMVFERLSQHCSEDFVRWNDPDEHSIRDTAALKSLLARKVDADGRFYLLTKFAIKDARPLVHRIATVRGGYDGLPYFMYVVGENRADARPHNQPCNGPHAPLRSI